MANSGEFTALFDNYRINKVLYRWVLRRDVVTETNNATPTANTLTMNYPRVSWVHDFNDQLSPASIQQLRQHANLREFIFSESRLQSKWYSINVSTLELMYRTSVTSATGPQWRQWIDTSLTDIPHYGIKYYPDGLFTGVNVVLEAKFLMEFKGVS